MRRFLIFVALCLVFPLAIAGDENAKSGPVGMYFVQIPWIADFILDEDKVVRSPLIWVFHSDGTFTQGDQDPDTVLSGYWRRAGKRTIAIRFISTALDWHQGFPPYQSVNLSEGSLEFSKDFGEFTGEFRTDTWICPHVPGTEPPWVNFRCPNPITTDMEPDYTTTVGEEPIVNGWRLPGPTK